MQKVQIFQNVSSFFNVQLFAISHRKWEFPVFKSFNIPIYQEQYPILL